MQRNVTIGYIYLQRIQSILVSYYYHKILMWLDNKPLSQPSDIEFTDVKYLENISTEINISIFLYLGNMWSIVH